MRILVDMDGVLAWWEKGFIARMRANFPDIPVYEFGTRKPGDRLSQAVHQADVRAVLDAPGLYRGLEPVAGGRAALESMLAAGHEVTICTAPSRTNPTCVYEKYEWLDEHLGAGWVDRTVIAFDKTLVDGDVLIDDRLHVTGARVPTWTHILFDQSYNRVPNRLRMLDWADWPNALKSIAGRA